MGEIPSLTVIVVETHNRSLAWSANPKPFLAFVAGNTQMRADGRTEQDAVDALRKSILSMAQGRDVKSVKVVEMRFDELLAQQVMDQ